ncbi:hypothetical protein B0T09DRAFT_170912 [Sordaria sp. MPI-SDFR-AT-0083]|nr:hypothetical protein B0T09DRAFT_170912 [Sordaria sp. MPI-SDFR-AT-0083]
MKIRRVTRGYRVLYPPVSPFRFYRQHDKIQGLFTTPILAPSTKVVAVLPRAQSRPEPPSPPNSGFSTRKWRCPFSTDTPKTIMCCHAVTCRSLRIRVRKMPFLFFLFVLASSFLFSRRLCRENVTQIIPSDSLSPAKLPNCQTANTEKPRAWVCSCVTTTKQIHDGSKAGRKRLGEG